MRAVLVHEVEAALRRLREDQRVPKLRERREVGQRLLRRLVGRIGEMFLARGGADPASARVPWAG